jgi:hypothetical protein
MPTTALAKAFAVTKATARRWKQKGAISQRYHSKLLAAHVTAPVKRKPFKSVTKRFKGAVTSGFVRKWIINSDADVFLATSFAAQVTQETEKLEKRGRKFQFRASGVAQFPINDSDVNVNAYRKGVIVVDPGASEYESRFDLNGFAHRQAGEALSDLVDQLFELATLPATVETIELVVRDYK